MLNCCISDKITGHNLDEWNLRLRVKVNLSHQSLYQSIHLSLIPSISSSLSIYTPLIYQSTFLHLSFYPYFQLFIPIYFLPLYLPRSIKILPSIYFSIHLSIYLFLSSSHGLFISPPFLYHTSPLYESIPIHLFFSLSSVNLPLFISQFMSLPHLFSINYLPLCQSVSTSPSFSPPSPVILLYLSLPLSRTWPWCSYSLVPGLDSMEMMRVSPSPVPWAATTATLRSHTYSQ